MVDMDGGTHHTAPLEFGDTVWHKFEAAAKCTVSDQFDGKRDRGYPTLRQGLRDPKIKNRHK
jgi:hypothetical protein